MHVTITRGPPARRRLERDFGCNNNSNNNISVPVLHIINRSAVATITATAIVNTTFTTICSSYIELYEIIRTYFNYTTHRKDTHLNAFIFYVLILYSSIVKTRLVFLILQIKDGYSKSKTAMHLNDH